MKEVVTKETLSITHTNISEEDKALGAEFNKTAWRALAVANRYLTHGPESARQNIVKSFIGVLSRLSAVDTESELEVSRTALLSELAQLKVLDAPSSPIPELANNQD